MRLKPVAKASSQHACGRLRRAALHYIVLAIKEACGISPVKRKGLKSGERGEGRSGPFPAVAKQIEYAKAARALGMAIHGRRIPVREIEVSVDDFRLRCAPRKISFRSARCRSEEHTSEL